MTETIAQSPTPRRKPLPDDTMSFPAAMQAVLEGKRITKLEWGDRETFGVLRNEVLMLHRSDTGWHKWIVSEGDMVSDDWVAF